MTCSETKLKISAHLDGALSALESRSVLSHVERCVSCRRFLREEESLTARLRASDFDLEPPAHLWERIESRIRPASVVVGGFGHASWLAPRRLGYALAASLLLALISGTLFLGSEPPDGRLLAQLDAYQISVPENPFLVQSEVSNPFFEPLAEVEGNPFDQMRSPK